jgi:hypothetical protein
MKTVLSSLQIVGPVILVVFLGTGCASISDAIRSKAEGTVMQYPVGFDDGWRIAKAVLRWENAETIEEHTEENYMVTTVGANLISAGSAIAVWVEPEGGQSVTVTIVSKRKMQTNLATGLTESSFHRRYAQAVDIVRSGQPLPLEAPKN